MAEIQYDKLVRDGIPEIVEADSATPIWRTLSGEAFKLALLEKVVEEAKELLESGGDIGERADLEAVLAKLNETQGWTQDDIDSARQEKAAKRGEFEKGIYLEKVITND